MNPKEKFLDGCYYPDCDAPHPQGKKFCGSDHKHLAPHRKKEFEDAKGEDFSDLLR